MITNIGIDIDGVIANFANRMRHLLQERFGITCLSDDFYKYSVQINALLDADPVACYEGLHMVHGADRVIEKWKMYGKKIFLITKRGNPKVGPTQMIESVKLTTKAWLSENKISYDALFFVNDKNIPIEFNKIDLFIDDEVKNVNNASELCTSLLYSHSFNCHDEISSNVYRVDNWGEIAWFVKNRDEGKI